MAEFCLTCWQKINNIHLSEKDVVLSKELDLCEECGKMKTVIVRYKKGFPFTRRIFNIIFRR